MLPDDVSAGGIRPGACNMLRCTMPADLAVIATGHDLRGTSAFYEYIDADRATHMPG
jgi:hypothetical protein